MPHNEALIVTVQIGTCSVRRVLVDQGSSAEVMYYSLFKQLKILELDFLLTDIPLVGFHGAPVWPLGQITLPVKAGSVTLSINCHCERAEPLQCDPWKGLAPRDEGNRFNLSPSGLIYWHQRTERRFVW